MNFEKWFLETWELMELDGSGRIQTTWKEFQADLKEAYEAGRNAALDEAAEVCQDEMDEQFCDSNPWYAARACRDAIRALKGETK